MSYVFSMYNDKNEYNLTYNDDNPDSATWTFQRLEDLFNELNRLQVNKVIVKLSIFDDNPEPIFLKLWKRIYRKAKANGFSLKIDDKEKELQSIGMLTR